MEMKPIGHHQQAGAQTDAQQWLPGDLPDSFVTSMASFGVGHSFGQFRSAI